jgi:hypothetical protein
MESALRQMLMAGMVLLAMAACAAPAQSPLQPGMPQPGITPTPLLGEFQAEVMSQRELWRERYLPTYRIRFEFIENAALPVKTYREVYVNNSSVRDAKCPIGACPTSIFKDVNTITDVFALLLRIPENCIVQVSYNRHLHYPEWVSADCADGISQPFVLRVRDVLQMM